jgi:hypothetical protein
LRQGEIAVDDRLALVAAHAVFLVVWLVLRKSLAIGGRAYSLGVYFLVAPVLFNLLTGLDPVVLAVFNGAGMALILAARTDRSGLAGANPGAVAHELGSIEDSKTGH